MARTATAELAIPQTTEEASQLMRELQVIQQKFEAIPLRRDKQVAEIKNEAKEEMAAIKKTMLPLIKALIAFAQARRDELTQGDKTKTVVLEPGKIRWRFTPKKVAIAKGRLADVIAAVKANLKRFWPFRDQPEIKLDKKAMLDKPELALELPFVAIQQSEVLVIELEDVTKKVIHTLRVLTTDEMDNVPEDLIESEPEAEEENGEG